MSTVTTRPILTDPTDADYRQGTCTDCAAPVIRAHGMWIRTDGNEVCRMNPRTLRHSVPA